MKSYSFLTAGVQQDFTIPAKVLHLIILEQFSSTTYISIFDMSN